MKNGEHIDHHGVDDRSRNEPSPRDAHRCGARSDATISPEPARKLQVLHQRDVRESSRLAKRGRTHEHRLIPVGIAGHPRAKVGEVEERSEPRAWLVGDGPRAKRTGDHARASERSRDVLGGVTRQRRVGVKKQEHVARRDGSSGIDAVKEILSRIDVPVIFITAFPERLLTGDRPEPTFLITKPFLESTVRAAISQAMFLNSTALPLLV